MSIFIFDTIRLLIALAPDKFCWWRTVESVNDIYEDWCGEGRALSQRQKWANEIGDTFRRRCKCAVTSDCQSNAQQSQSKRHRLAQQKSGVYASMLVIHNSAKRRALWNSISGLVAEEHALDGTLSWSRLMALAALAGRRFRMFQTY